MERRSWSPVTAAIVLTLVCLSLWQLTGCPGPPTQSFSYISGQPAYTIVSNINVTDEDSIKTSELPPWDLSTLIDLPDFYFTVINYVCNESAPLLLVLVHSAPENFAKRKTIRETWGQRRNGMRLLFMLGAVEKPYVQLKLEDENAAYQDLVQGSFQDAYRNMTYKHVMALKYVVYYCPTVRYVLKSDDDVFVNMPDLIDFLHREFSPLGLRKLMMCQPLHDAVVKRSYRSKWRVSFSEYRDRYYPSYCPGWAVMYSPDVVFDLYREAQRSEYFWIDDVHITGTLAKRLGIHHTPADNLVLSETKLDCLINEKPDKYELFLYGMPNLPQNVIHQLWAIVGDTAHTTSKVPSPDLD